MADDPLTECKVCGAPVQRVFHPVAVHFKGSGFYTTDYGKKKGKGAKEGGGSSESKPSDSSDSKASSDSNKTDSSKKTPAKSD